MYLRSRPAGEAGGLDPENVLVFWRLKEVMQACVEMIRRVAQSVRVIRRSSNAALTSRSWTLQRRW